MYIGEKVYITFSFDISLNIYYYRDWTHTFHKTILTMIIFLNVLQVTNHLFK